MRVSAVVIHMITGFLVLMLGITYAAEPTPPRVDLQFNQEKEHRINQLVQAPLPSVFKAFSSPEFFDEDAYLDKAIFLAFNHRGPEAVKSAMQYIRSPQAKSSIEGARNLYIAKRVAQVFPDEFLDDLLDLYSGAGPKVQANIIYVTGQMAGGEAVRTLLMEALNDTTDCQQVTGETMGQPMRVCDVAYNQLIIRYKIRNALRATGTAHTTEMRDHHIQLLQDRLY